MTSPLLWLEMWIFIFVLQTYIHFLCYLVHEYVQHKIVKINKKKSKVNITKSIAKEVVGWPRLSIRTSFCIHVRRYVHTFKQRVNFFPICSIDKITSKVKPIYGFRSVSLSLRNNFLVLLQACS